MKEVVWIYLVIAFQLALICGICAWNKNVWDECRESGASRSYCLRVIAR